MEKKKDDNSTEDEEFITEPLLPDSEDPFMGSNSSTESDCSNKEDLMRCKEQAIQAWLDKDTARINRAIKATKETTVTRVESIDPSVKEDEPGTTTKAETNVKD